MKAFSIDAAVAYNFTRLTGGGTPEVTASALRLNVGPSVYFLR